MSFIWSVLSFLTILACIGGGLLMLVSYRPAPTPTPAPTPAPTSAPTPARVPAEVDVEAEEKERARAKAIKWGVKVL